LLASATERALGLKVPYKLKAYADYDEEEFDCDAFYSPVYFKENNIFQVHVDDLSVGRVGWIFPVQSLVSDQHDFAENHHFLRYAFVTFFKMLRGQLWAGDQVFAVAGFEDQIELTDIYPSNLSVFSQSKGQTGKLPSFNPEDYLHSFYTYRFFWCGHAEDISQISSKIPADKQLNTLTISKMSEALNDEPYIRSLFRTHFRLENHPLVQFHLLYQIVELMINRISGTEIKGILDLAKTESTNIQDIGFRLKRLSGEEYKIRLLFDDYLSKKPGHTAALISSCNDLIRHFDSEKRAVVDALYRTRNLLVHNFHAVTSKDRNLNLVKAVNIDFENLLADILSLYVEKNAAEESFGSDPLAWLVYQVMNE
jgi:hypothetical protein